MDSTAAFVTNGKEGTGFGRGYTGCCGCNLCNCFIETHELVFTMHLSRCKSAVMKIRCWVILLKNVLIFGFCSWVPCQLKVNGLLHCTDARVPVS